MAIQTTGIQSPLDVILRAISEDKQNLLNNQSLFAMLKEHGLDTDPEKVAACYELAFEKSHPYIYPVADRSITSREYTLNFLWINLNPQSRVQDVAQNIFGEGLDLTENADCIIAPQALRKMEETETSLEGDTLKNWQKIKKSFIYRLSKWADLHPGANINLWYDSALVTQKARNKTSEMLRSISQSRDVHLKLRDVRQLPNLGGEIGLSLHPGVPVYFRVDLLKALITDYMISSPEETAQYCVVVDIDNEPMSSAGLFDQRTQNYLSSWGYVFCKDFAGGVCWMYENCFFIFNKENKDLQKKHHLKIIQMTSEIITYFRYCKFYPFISMRDHRKPRPLNSQTVWDLYPDLFEKMGECWRIGSEHPRKVIKHPTSQFYLKNFDEKRDFKTEVWRFCENEDIPCARWGRYYVENGDPYHERSAESVDALMGWKADPLITEKDIAFFREVADLLSRTTAYEVEEAMDRFSRMPKKAREAIYGKIYHILKPFKNDYWGCGEDAFLNRNGQSSTPEQKAQAIEAYLADQTS